ncbi:glycosyltransferase family 4 protein [Paenibacillus mesophilus]|uniref:glycosyltransferase n=1 Tax=Paenibacillus mesophilus TaxID=2582849 RepID=UPI00110EEDD6|nr:glycosyltransferase [Paenibacillus mesophilus]TMV47497.1 glycosyltransferase family 4 protein [Paenibacillus mesophilus]
MNRSYGVSLIRKKVVLIAPFPTSDKPASYSYVKTRVEALKDTHDISVIQVNISDRVQNGITRLDEDGYAVYRIDVKYWNVRHIGFFYHQLKIKKAMLELLLQLKPDLIHVHFSQYYSWIALEISKKMKIQLYITEHASHFEQSTRRFWVGPRIRKALHEADRLFAVSDSLRRTMQKCVSREIEVKPNIVNTAIFTLKPEHVPREPIIKLITVGSLDHGDKKGYELLLRALGELRNDYPHFRLLIVGEGPNRGKLEKMIGSYHLSDNVRLTGSIPNDQLAGYYHDADLYVSSSRIETFGVVLIEAMSCGLPVLATKSGGPETLIRTESGLLVEKESWQSLYEGLKVMLGRLDSYKPETIRQHVVDFYSVEVYKSTMTRVYDGLLASR